MKKNILAGIICLLLVVTGCSKNTKKTETKKTSSSESTGVVVREVAQNEISDAYGVILKTISLEYVGSTLNLQVVIANETNEDKEFDFSKFSVKTYSNDILKVNGTKKTVKANSSYNQYSFTVNDSSKLEVGNLAYVYYDETSLGPVEVKEF